MRDLLQGLRLEGKLELQVLKEQLLLMSDEEAALPAQKLM